MKTFIKEQIPQIHVVDSEGLYLIWVDMRELKMNKIELEMFMLEKAHLWLDEGYVFGHGEEGFEGFNIACPRCVLIKVLNQLKKAINILE